MLFTRRDLQKRGRCGNSTSYSMMLSRNSTICCSDVRENTIQSEIKAPTRPMIWRDDWKFVPRKAILPIGQQYGFPGISRTSDFEDCMSEVTRVLRAYEQGDDSAADELLPLVYDELRRLAAAKIAQERAGDSLQATGLVHEAYMRLVDADQVQRWDSRGHFFAAAAEAMR